MTLDERLRGVIAAAFGVDAAKLGDQDSPRTIEAWDSVNHMHLILALEAEFGVRFDPAEIGELTSVGAIRTRLAQDVPGG